MDEVGVRVGASIADERLTVQWERLVGAEREGKEEWERAGAVVWGKIKE